MQIYGVDFTSRPTRRKPVTGVAARLDGRWLVVDELLAWTDFAGFEGFLRARGPWIAGIDFPFGMPRRFLENIGWPLRWADYVALVARMDRPGFRATLDRYRSGRAAGDREHRRGTDVAAGAISPQKLYGTPVGLMFFEGAPRLLAAGVEIPGLHHGDPQRVVVEAYPGMLARRLIGRRGYKQDARAKQTREQHEARRELLDALSAACPLRIGPDTARALVDDPGGDRLDALLCAVQAAWAWARREENYGAPQALDPAEGWIVSAGEEPAPAGR